MTAPGNVSFADVRVGSIVSQTIAECSSAGAFGPFAELAQRVSPCDGAKLLGVQWEALPYRGDMPVSAQRAVTRWLSDGDGSGRVHESIRLVNAEGVQLQEAVLRWRVDDVGGALDVARQAAVNFASLPWAEHIGERLRSLTAFTSTTRTFDGSIGFSAGDDEVAFRIYRGSIIEVARRSAEGSTFTVDASERSWVELMQSPRVDFIRRAGRHEIRVRGNGFQYLRMVKAVMLIIQEARASFREANGA